ncbi:nucleotidyl transferase AbiEii/AbiGii toxin family protein [Frisingicoccus sp.]|uniref:nucleotidyl transferase AbiEii/AbiGii toxin family protein n=1 Tax=Frisingicoccus sp. TaxID=1918627 RepID=UPI003AB37358
MISAISVKDRLKNQVKEDGRTMQDELVTYGLERAIYRLSISEYAERFTLKGGIFLYALFDGNFARATMDIDLLAQHISNDAEEMKKVFHNIFSMECDDALRFDLDSLDVINITEFKEYHWILVRVRKNKKAFLWTYERSGQLCINIKVDPKWRDFWRSAYASVLPGYHQNKNHWNTVILDGTVPKHEIQRMIAESYDLVI